MVVADGYFSPLEPNGKRHDIASRPELIKGSVDFVASSEYIQKQLGPLKYVFVIDVSEHSVTSGMLQVLLDTLRYVKSCWAIVKSPPGNS